MILNNKIKKNLIECYKDAGERIIFLDYDGTLVPFTVCPDTALPDKRVLEQLKRLSSDPHNTVVIISGRSRGFLSAHFDHMNIYLAAEHGAFLKKPAESWQVISDRSIETDWQKDVYTLIHEHTNHCVTSFIEVKETSVAWHFRNVEEVSACLCLEKLKRGLSGLLAHHPRLQILEGNKIIEVKYADFNKGIPVEYFVRSKRYDFVLAIGDDTTDEDMFKALTPEDFTIKVGLNNSAARYNLTLQSETNDLIDKMLGDK